MCKYFFKDTDTKWEYQDLVTFCELIQYYNEIDFHKFVSYVGSTSEGGL